MSSSTRASSHERKDKVKRGFSGTVRERSKEDRGYKNFVSPKHEKKASKYTPFNDQLLQLKDCKKKEKS